MGFGSVITGLAIYKPVQLYWLSWLCGGYHLARIFHFALTVGYVLFFMIHIVQVILAGWNNFRAIVSGFEVREVQVVIEHVEIPAIVNPEILPNAKDAKKGKPIRQKSKIPANLKPKKADGKKDQ